MKIALVMALTIMFFTPILKLKADEVDYSDFSNVKKEKTDDEQLNNVRPTASVTVGYKATSLLSNYKDITHLDCVAIDYYQSLGAFAKKKRIVNLALAVGIDYCIPPTYSFYVFKPTALLGIDINAYTTKTLQISPFVLTGASYYTVMLSDVTSYIDMDSFTYVLTTGVKLYLRHSVSVAFQFNVEYDPLNDVPVYSGSITAGFWF